METTNEVGTRATERKLPKKQVFGYLMGVVPLTLFGGFYGLAYTKFFYHDLKLQTGYWITALVIYAVVNMFNDPLLGNMSDNTDVNKRGSRRIFYIKYAAPLLTVMFLLIWWIPTDHGSQFLLFLHLVITICFFETFFTMATICWYALLPEMTNDVDERANVNFLGMIIVMFAGLPIVLISTLDHEQIKMTSVVVAVIGLICYIFVVKFSKERLEFRHEKALPLKESIKQTWKSKSFRIYAGYNFINMVGSSINASFLFLFWFWIGEENVFYYFLIVFVVGYGSNLLCLRLRKKYGIINLITVFSILRFIGGVITFILVLSPSTESLLWVGLIWIYFFNGAEVFTYILQTAPIDDDELSYGTRREGMFFGINALFTQPANSLGPIIGTGILLAFGYVQGADAINQVPSVFTGIKFMTLVFPHLLALIGVLIVRRYPFDNKKLEEIQQKLIVLHQEKQVTSESMAIQKEKKI
jgi:Na+/melibiose symporter-like transporter